MIINIPLCMMCKHLLNTDKEHWLRCKAFPKGIPNEIVFGRVDDHQKYPGDRGIVFQAKIVGDAAKLYDSVDRRDNTENKEVIEKNWADWSKFRKPKYDPSNKKSVSACKKFARNGVFKPGCNRAMFLAESMYEPGKDEDSYQGYEPVDPKKFFSQIKAERDKEREKQMALSGLDRIFDAAMFTRDSMGRIVITNWYSLSLEDKQTLAGLFDEKGVLLDSKFRDFDRRYKDFNSRRIKRGLSAKPIA